LIGLDEDRGQKMEKSRQTSFLKKFRDIYGEFTASVHGDIVFKNIALTCK